MERCSTSNLGQKDVINICTAENLGFVTDIEFEVCEGKIVSLIVGDCSSLGFSKSEELRIPWCRIVRIGEDAILVDVVIADCKCNRGDDKKKKKRSFFEL